MNILKQLKEVTLSVLPIGLFALILSLVFGVMDTGEMLAFLLSCILVIIGLTFFLTGVDVGLLPIGNRIGSALTKSRSLIIMLAAAVVLGVIITIPEPDVTVLARQVHSVNPAINTGLLSWCIAIGVGIFLSISLARTVLGWKMKWIIAVSYVFIFLAAFFNEDFFVSVAFDSGGATTGPLSVPFIMALGMGVATLRHGDEEAQFGYVAFSSIGPVLAVLILGLAFNDPASGSVLASEEAVPGFWQLLGSKFSEVGVSLLPLIAVIVICLIFFLRLPRIETVRVAVGILWAYIGIAIFFTGVEYSFSDVARELGAALMSRSPLLLYGVGFVFGLFVVLAEPAVIVLTEQIEEASNGKISRSLMLATLALGVGLAVVLALLRTVEGFSIWYLLFPGYVLIMLAMVRTPGLFSAIAFDSGGVATGPMSSTFLLPLAMGAASGNASMSLTASFGMIAMIAMMPILLTELLGIWYAHREKEAKERTK